MLLLREWQRRKTQLQRNQEDYPQLLEQKTQLTNPHNQLCSRHFLRTTATEKLNPTATPVAPQEVEEPLQSEETNMAGEGGRELSMMQLMKLMMEQQTNMEEKRLENERRRRADDLEIE